MDNSVIIKGTKSGIILVLDKEMEFSQLLEKVALKFKESSKFLGNVTVAVTFEGRELDNEQEKALVDVIQKNSDLYVACIVENDQQREELFRKSLDERLMELTTNTGQFYKGNLRSGQVLDVETSIIIIGDVNIGAKVVSKGNIIVLGSLKGNAFAGAGGNEKAFVVAVDMNPLLIRIADIIGKLPEKPTKHKKTAAVREPKIAYADKGELFIESLNKNVLNDICL